MAFLESNLLYLLLLVFSIAYPIAQSFERRITFYKKWPALFPGILVMMAIFIPWDIWFTHEGVWWFNYEYTTGIKIANLPLEEWLFFLCIPFSCFFIYEVLVYFVKKDVLKSFTRPFLFVAALALLLLSFIYLDRLYTFVCFLSTGIAVLITLYFNPYWLSRFLLSYFVSLIPFMLVNGILTGSFIKSPIVNYNPEEIIGFRILTVPVEDSIYNLLMLLTVMWVYKKFRVKE